MAVSLENKLTQLCNLHDWTLVGYQRREPAGKHNEQARDPRSHESSSSGCWHQAQSKSSEGDKDTLGSANTQLSLSRFVGLMRSFKPCTYCCFGINGVIIRSGVVLSNDNAGALPIPGCVLCRCHEQKTHYIHIKSRLMLSSADKPSERTHTPSHSSSLSPLCAHVHTIAPNLFSYCFPWLAYEFL